jgi:ribonuclease P protein component
MIKQNTKISKKKDFDDIFKKGKAIKGSFLIIRFLRNNKDRSRFAFIVSKKVSLKAVDRNKIRRRLSEAVKKYKEILAGTDIIFIVLPQAKLKSFLEIKEEITVLLNKIIKNR